jgi:hypothetical protein
VKQRRTDSWSSPDVSIKQTSIQSHYQDRHGRAPGPIAVFRVVPRLIWVELLQWAPQEASRLVFVFVKDAKPKR